MAIEQPLIIPFFIYYQEVTERHEAVMAQLMSGEPRNQNIPGLDTILRGEILRKDTLITQLMNQNKMLMSAKERQDLEITSQGETLEVIINSVCKRSLGMLFLLIFSDFLI